MRQAKTYRNIEKDSTQDVSLINRSNSSSNLKIMPLQEIFRSNTKSPYLKTNVNLSRKRSMAM